MVKLCIFLSLGFYSTTKPFDYNHTLFIELRPYDLLLENLCHSTGVIVIVDSMAMCVSVSQEIAASTDKIGRVENICYSI